MTTTVIILSLLLVLGGIVFFATFPALPPDTNAAIQIALKQELPELIKGKTATINNNGIEIWYNVMKPKGEIKGTILLIMGHSATALSFPAYLFNPMLDKGYQVIRYDNRGVGMSDWMLEEEKKDYTLEDMATDAIAILDQENLDKVHVWGVSMGGMIAQRLALSYSERFISLTSIMSSGFTHDPELKIAEPHLYRKFVQLILRYGLIDNEVNGVKFALGIKNLLRGKGDYEINTLETVQRSLYERRKRRGANKKVADQHTNAIMLSGSRLGELPHLTVPMLIIHGKKDPLVLPEHGKKYSKAAPQAKTVWIEGMAHDLPEKFIGEILNLSFEHFVEAEKVGHQEVEG